MSVREVMHIQVVSTDELGDRSYVVHDGSVAVVVDPQRDIDRVERYLAGAGVAASLILETHIHNDYVTGGFQLARRTGARYGVNAADPVAFDRLQLRGGDASTLGIERPRNDALTARAEQSFTGTLIANLPAYPAYYAHIAPRNLQGPQPVDLSAPQTTDAAELAKRIAAGDWVVDLRDRVLYAADHLAGSIGIPLATQFATYLGWLMPWDTPLTLIGDHPEQVTAAQRQLARIGLDRPAGAATGDLDTLTAPSHDRRHYPRGTLPAIPDARPGDIVLDLPRPDARAARYLPGSA